MDQTESQPQSNITAGQPVVPPAEPKKSVKKWLILLIVLLLVGLAALGFLYFRSTEDVSRQAGEISDLKAEIAAIESADTGSEAPAADPVEANCAGGSSYEAEIGKFSIDLDNPRVIIRELDAGFEGGPITRLAIGSCLVDENTVVDSYPTDEVTIIGHPRLSAAELRSNYESSLGGAGLTADGSVTIAGVAADKYTFSGLFDVTVIFFDNDGIGYQIELAHTGDTTNAILDDVIDDWAFTP